MSDLTTLEQRVVAATEAVRVASAEVQTALAELTTSDRADKRIISSRLTTALENLGAAQLLLEAARNDAAALKG